MSHSLTLSASGVKYNSKTLNVFSNYSRFNLMYDNKVEDINMLLDFITKNMDTTYLHEVKQELNNIKNQLLIGSKEKRPDMDFIDSRLLMYSEFDYLVHDIHANLPKYEEVISKQTKKGDEDIPPTLKKN